MIINMEDKGLFYSEGEDFTVFLGIAYSKEKNSISSFLIAAPNKRDATRATQQVLVQNPGGYRLVSVKRLSDMLKELDVNSEGNWQVNIVRNNDLEL